MTHLRLVLLAFIASTAGAADIVVYGATPAGIAAAVTAARTGRSVELLEPSARVGGLLTGGLSYTDFRTQESVTGFFREYLDEVLGYYSTTYGPDSQQVKDCFFGAHAEPKVSLEILQSLLNREPSLTVKTGWRLDSVQTAAVQGSEVRILAALSDGGDRLEGKAFIDASYEGDLAAAAGAPYRVGRESAQEYGERFAGRLYMQGGKILPGSTGEGDGLVQCYNFRILMTRDPALLVPLAKPERYRRDEYAEAMPHFHGGVLEKAFTENHDGVLRIQMLPNGKADINDIKHSPLRLALPGETNGWPEGSAADRKRIFERHKGYALGLLWFLQTDPDLPESIRANAREWGFAKDEFEETGHFPPALYVREARRIVGRFVFTERDTQPAVGVRAPLHQDSIAIGDYSLNSHGHGKAGALHPGVTDGDFSQSTAPFQVPYGVIVPQRVSNLLVPVALSASHVGYSALRLEPTWTALGHAAGLAADLALASGSGMKDVVVSDLQARLLSQRAALIFTSDVTVGSPLFETVQRFGLRGFLHDAAEAHPSAFGSLEHRHGLQYAWPFPHHALRPEMELDAGLRRLWMARLTASEKKRAPQDKVTRGEFLTAVGGPAAR